MTHSEITGGTTWPLTLFKNVKNNLVLILTVNMSSFHYDTEPYRRVRLLVHATFFVTVNAVSVKGTNAVFLDVAEPLENSYSSL